MPQTVPSNPPLILQPFASSGDKDVVPQSDANGFVNYTDGYTQDYEIDLNSNNPNAKAVERKVQNFLFYQSTTIESFWQQMTAAPWDANMPGGYARGAIVGRVSPGDNGVWRIYRSIVDVNVQDPNTAARTVWEYIPLNAEILSQVAMPAGGGGVVNPGGQTTELVGVATNFNTLLNGTWEFASDAIANGSANSPIQPGLGTAFAGMLQSKTWVSGANTSTVQQYNDNTGNVFFRGCLNGSFTSWRSVTLVNNFSVDSSAAANVIQGNTPLSGAVIDNQQFWVQVAVSNTGTTTFSPQVGVPAVELVGSTYASLQGGELPANSRALVVYRASTNKYVLAAVVGGVMTQGNPTKRLHGVSLAAVLDSLGVATVTCTGPTNAYVGTSTLQPFAALVDGMIIKMHASASSTGTATFNLDGLGARNILTPWGEFLQNNEIVSGWFTFLQYSQAANAWVLLPIGGGNLPTRPATSSRHAVNLGQWTALRGTPGWWKSPDGTIVQWGQINIPGTQTQIIGNFPISFPTAVNGIVSSDIGNTAWATGINAVSPSQFQIFVPTYYPVGTATNQPKNSQATLNWWAIGY